MHNITNLWKFELINIGSQSCERTMEEKKHPCRISGVLSDAWELRSRIQFKYYSSKKLLLSQKLRTWEGAVSHTALNIARVTALKYFE